MTPINGYVILEKTNQTRTATTYIARGNGTNIPETVVIKVFGALTDDRISAFRHVMDTIIQKDLTCIARPREIIQDPHGTAVVFDYFKGVSLKQMIGMLPSDITRFLKIAGRIAETVGHLHKSDLIHGSLSPHAILIDEKDLPCITDVGVHALLSLSDAPLARSGATGDLLAYISPEQTGRLSRAVDYRTDIYSLGVIFYELLTGHAPFPSDDPIEVIHGHLAREPLPVDTANPEIPPVVSAIVMKMIQKMPEARYQNGLAIAYDLKRCLDQLRHGKSIRSFPLAEKDMPVKYVIPRMVVGRDNELNEIQGRFDHVRQGKKEMLLVEGPPGIGKSSLIDEAERRILTQNGWFIRGKFDQYRRDIPLNAIIQAFSGLIKRILAEGDTQIAQWREKIITAVGNNGQILTDVIPSLEIIIGDQPLAPVLDVEEQKNRFTLTFKNFLKVFADERHSLTLFLDDLQWADQASMALLTALMTDPTIRHLYLIAALRNDTPAPSHFLMPFLNELTHEKTAVTQISLGPLTVSETRTLTDRFLRSAPSTTIPLARVVHRKTGGNPFFIHQFLKTLHEADVFTLDPDRGWTWDMERIEKKRVTENVVDLLADKLSKLPDSSQKVLQICACIGNRHDIDLIADVSGHPRDSVMTAIHWAVQEGYIAVHGETHAFQHDRIQEVVYSMIPEAEKKRLHAEIGRIVLANTPEEAVPDNAMFIVAQLNQGQPFLDATERMNLALLNLRAGDKALSAHASALVYFREGIALLDKTAWQTHYALTFALHKNLMKCEYLSTNYDQAEAVFRMTVINAQSPIDKADMHKLMVHLKTLQGKFEEAIGIGMEGLHVLGQTDLRPDMSLTDLIAEYDKTKGLINRLEQDGLSLEAISGWPVREDSVINKVIKLIGVISTPAIIVNPLLTAVMALKPLNFILEHRTIFAKSSYSFPAAGTILCGLFKDYELGYRIGEIGLRFPHTVAQFFLSFGMCILHWKQHVMTSRRYLMDGYMFGVERGQVDVAGLCLISHFRIRFFFGENLDQVYNDLITYQDFFRSNRHRFNDISVRIIIYYYKRLKKTAFTPSIDSDIMELKQGDRLIYSLIGMLIKVIVHYLIDEDYQACIALCEEADKSAHGWLGTAFMPELYLFYALTLSALAEADDAAPHLIEKLKQHGALFQTWAGLCEANYLHRHKWIQAELARLEGKTMEAARLYCSAAEIAASKGYINHQAMIYECAGRLYARSGLEDIARMYRRKAYEGYRKWGASAKTSQMESKLCHPQAGPNQRHPGGIPRKMRGFTQWTPIRFSRPPR